MSVYITLILLRSPSPNTAFPDLIWLLKPCALQEIVGNSNKFLSLLYEAGQINKDNINCMLNRM